MTINYKDKKAIIMDYYKLVEDYVLGYGNDLEEVKEGFLKSINSDTKKRDSFISSLSKIKYNLSQDLDFFMMSDPAADNKEEIILSYPGFKAIRHYRIAHELFNIGEKIIARIITEEAHKETGVDIHPGAMISSPFFIDHGTGIVIGETTIIGKYVKLYQGVTLGALSLSDGYKLKGVKRHPTVGDYVTIYANASILGGDAVIGSHVTIGGNVFLTESVKDNMKVTISKPELVFMEGKNNENL